MLKNITKHLKKLNFQSSRKNHKLTTEIAEHFKGIIELVGEDVNRQGNNFFLEKDF